MYILTNNNLCVKIRKCEMGLYKTDRSYYNNIEVEKIDSPTSGQSEIRKYQFSTGGDTPREASPRAFGRSG